MLYDSLVSSLEDYVLKTHQEWLATPQCTTNPKLNTPLMGRGKNSFLTVTFHKDLARTFHEVHYFQKLRMDVPFIANESFSKREELRTLTENVLLVVRDYNTIIETYE
jgi:dynein heavy chain